MHLGRGARYLVDLAGSERVKRSGAAGAQFTETVAINTALSALGRVVSNLVSNDGKRAAHISYKDNPLTHLLKSGIGGNSKTALICCITAAADSLDESHKSAVVVDGIATQLDSSTARNELL